MDIPRSVWVSLRLSSTPESSQPFGRSRVLRENYADTNVKAREVQRPPDGAVRILNAISNGVFPVLDPLFVFLEMCKIRIHLLRMQVLDFSQR